jgi:hypothetical protein
MLMKLSDRLIEIQSIAKTLTIRFSEYSDYGKEGGSNSQYNEHIVSPTDVIIGEDYIELSKSARNPQYIIPAHMIRVIWAPMGFPDEYIIEIREPEND